MAKEKTYRYDDVFKAQARAHQFEYKESVLNDFYNEKNPRVILSEQSSKQGLIFCEEYRDLILQKGNFKTFGTSALFSNMLRSEHIPYNVFTPMEEDLDNAALLFNEILGGGIAKIKSIKIEFAGNRDRTEYLNDGTSFDTFIEYERISGGIGGIGIEVKYTENGYPLGEKEKKDIKDPKGAYRLLTAKSNYLISDLDINIFLKANHIRQIWRNHLLGFAMLDKGDIQTFHHIHLYPKGNEHFHNHALPEYRKLLTENGRNSFVELTYEDLLQLLPNYFKSAKQMRWIQYLNKRYML